MSRSIRMRAVFGAAAAVLCLASAATAQTQVVFVHGAWGGGWSWQGMDLGLREHGFVSYRVTLTGLGERMHLSTPEIGHETHVNDVVNAILFEDLHDIVLVGHSYGGFVITAVAERIPDRIARLVYVDAMVPFDGETVAGLMGIGAADDSGDLPEFSVPRWVSADAPYPKDVPQSMKTFRDPIRIEGEPGRGIPTAYLLTVDAPGQPDAFDMFAERARSLGWEVSEMVADHVPYASQPEAFLGVLRELLRPGG